MCNIHVTRVSNTPRHMARNRYLLAPFLVLLAACYPDPALPPQQSGEEWGPEETMRVLRAAGEWSSPNELSAPEGAALRAVNVVVDDPGKYTTHKGFEASAEPPRVLSSFTLYDGAIIAHSQSEGRLERLVGGVWTEYAGVYTTPDGLPMSFLEQQGSLFFTTSTGVFRLDGATSTPTLSGLPQALPGQATLTGASGFLDGGEAVVYRANWAVKVDTGLETERLVEGAPSPRLLVSNGNAPGTDRDVSLSFPIPDGLPTGAFLRVFRSDIVPNTLSPLDEVRQVYEREPTPAELSDMVFTFTDTTPDTVKGAGAYYSANSGEGIALSNFRAPLARGISCFAQSIFGVGVDGVQSVTINLLGVEAPDGLVLNDGFSISDGVTTEEYRAISAPPDTSTGFFFGLFSGGTPAQNLANTIESICRAINRQPSGLAMAYALDTDGTQPGRFIIQRRSLDQTELVFRAIGNSAPWLPRPKSRLDVVGGLARVAGVVTVTDVVTAGLQVGQEIELVEILGGPDPDFPYGVKTISAINSAIEFEYLEAGADASTMAIAYFETTNPEVTTDDGTALNAYAWSKKGEPDHWPLQNINTVGDSTDTLWWGQPLDRYQFLGSEGGLFRLTGTADEGFTDPENGSPWDSNVRFLGRRNVASLDGQVFALAQEGIVAFSESARPQAVDTPIQSEVREAILNYPEAVAEFGFFVADGLNHRLYVALPESAAATSATKLHILNLKPGGAWSRLTTTFPGLEEGVLAGMAPADGNGRLYVIPYTAVGDGITPVLSTRNAGTLADYQGPDGEGLPAKVTYLPWVAGEPERLKQWTWSRLFTSDVSAVQFCYASDWVPTEECQALPSMDPERTTPVPVSDPVRSLAWKSIIGAAPGQSYQRARALTVSVGHSVAQEKFELLGAEVQHRAFGKGQ